MKPAPQYGILEPAFVSQIYNKDSLKDIISFYENELFDSNFSTEEII
jgi:hypothetical protein